MSLLDTVIGGLLGGGAGNASPMGNILSSLITGGQSGGVGGFGGFGGNAGQGVGGMGDGLGSLISQFQNAGLGHLAQSWVGNGQNRPMSPQQLQDVFGQDQIQGMADHAGMDQGSFLSQLSQHLPNAVNGMTPNGALPDEGTMSV